MRLNEKIKELADNLEENKDLLMLGGVVFGYGLAICGTVTKNSDFILKGLGISGGSAISDTIYEIKMNNFFKPPFIQSEEYLNQGKNKNDRI